MRKLYLVAVVGAVLIVGGMDHQDQLDAEKHYAEMVCAGYWPDYDDRQPECGGEG